jgi:hypothetical protein
VSVEKIGGALKGADLHQRAYGYRALMGRDPGQGQGPALHRGALTSDDSDL